MNKDAGLGMMTYFTSFFIGLINIITLTNYWKEGYSVVPSRPSSYSETAMIRKGC